MTYDRENLPTGTWADYRQKATTRMIAVVGPFTVTTKEGQYDLPCGWEGFIALDTDGDPYPIEIAVQSRSYEPVA